MSSCGLTLVCFAVKEEAASFQKLTVAQPHIRICVTGMGQANAERSFLAACEAEKPVLVVSSGFAGALRPNLPTGAVVFDCERNLPLFSALNRAGALSARFFCAKQVAVTAQEKQRLRNQTGADAVEMESQVIRMLCLGRGIPSATVRVILDTASQDLPLDFNRLMNRRYEIQLPKLVWQMARSPGRIPGLMRFQAQCQAAAKALAEVLSRALS